ncbi:MAG TPA: hypothetical protein VL485_17745 [Ktedonobacteraceae bacterium]|jgi:hypothetical protein|nr:hypothetical protein [Ktedonobacteraceae bacterium]
MTTEIQSRQVVRSYHDAWISGDVTTAGTFLSNEFTNLTPLTNYYEPAPYLDQLRKFSQQVTGFDMLSELYGTAEATLVYDVHTSMPVGTIRTVEHFRLTDGKISTIILVFDATPWHKMLEVAGK